MKLQRSRLFRLAGVVLAALTIQVIGHSAIGHSDLVAQVMPDDPMQIVQDRGLDVPYVPTPQEVVDEMLRLANVQKTDKLYDLGSGDGRIVVTAAKQFGTRGVGVDLDPARVQEANNNARKAGVTDLVEFRRQDLFQTDLREATVVTLYLLPEVNLRLRPKLLRELKPGTRIVSHAFDMGDWKPEKIVRVGGRTIYFWTVPTQTSEQPQSNQQR